jgi:hypothetical protein
MLAAQPVAPVPVATITPEDLFAFAEKEPSWGAGRRKRVTP